MGGAQVLRAAREEAGLSLHALALRMGVSWDTVRRAERERDPRLSTLRLHAAALPFVSTGELLGAGPSAPLASAAAWRLHRRFQGHVVRCLVHDVTLIADGTRRVRQSWEIRGVGLDLADEEQRTNVLRATVVAPRDVLRDLRAAPADSRGVARRFETPGARHELRFHRPLRARGFTYVREWLEERSPPELALSREADAALLSSCAVDVGACVERLELRVGLGPGAACPWFAAFASPEASVPAGSAFAMARDLHPHAIDADWNAKDGVLVVTIPRPQPHVRHGVAWRSGGGKPSRFLSARTALRDAREAEGLSSRELARRARVSPSTILSAEHGGDARRRTLRRCLEVLPLLRASELIGACRGSREIPLPEIWLHQRAVAGVVAREASRVVTVTASGDAREVIALRGLRGLHPGGDLVIRDAIAGTQAGRVGTVLLEGDDPRSTEWMRVRWRRLRGEQDEFHLVIPAALAEKGASFTRKESKTAAYRVRADQAGRSIGPAFECVVPAERLVLEVRLPRRVRIEGIRPFVRAAVAVTNPRWPDLTRLAHPEGVDFAWSETERVARLVVERPLMGLRYSIAWTLG